MNSNLETDDGSSRYLMHNNYFVYATAATDFAMNAHWLYQVNNVYAYALSVMAGWSPDKDVPSATNCYVYNGTFFMLGDHGVCKGDHFGGSELDDSVIHTTATNITACGAVATASVALAPPAPDAVVTARAKAVLGEYPKPFRGEDVRKSE